MDGIDEKTLRQLESAADAVDPGFRTDGYVSLLSKYGTAQDNGTSYRFQAEPWVPDADLTVHYEANGLFTKIIDLPAEKAATGQYELGINDADIDAYVNDKLEDIKWQSSNAQALKWSRLFGGGLAVMLIDDGRELEEPLDWEGIRDIEELVVFERFCVDPDYLSAYGFGGLQGGKRKRRFGMPEFYRVSSQYGSFSVHESRCLVYRNGVLPENTSHAHYRFWGLPEYIRIRQALQDTVTTHGNAFKLLNRMVQAVYKMKDLAGLLATDAGEGKVLERLRVIDMARGILNSLAIDAEGEDYSYATFSLAGVKDIVDSACNLLSAETNIPQTLLFGRSPAGENSTGESDFENYYTYCGQIQELQVKDNHQHLLDIIFRAGVNSGRIKQEPDYKLKYLPLWNLSETEQAAVEKTRADAGYVKAQTAQLYVDMTALDSSEVRRGLKASEEFLVEDLLDGDEDDDLLEGLMGGDDDE